MSGRHLKSIRRPLTAVTLATTALFLLPAFGAEASDRVPATEWLRYIDVAEAGFDAAALADARAVWESLPSSAFMVISGGAVVASWGDVARRFMCHSVRKSFLTGLYGIYWDRGDIDLNKTLEDLGIDDEPGPLLGVEKQARILDLLKARSGVFHPAAYSGRTDSRPRGSQGPGRFFAYNNWDFNTAAAILMQETGDDVFEAFDEHFAGPLGMADWRVSDGYYHYERDKSQYPAYPFRLSARDAARFGLLYAREGLWGDQRVLSRQWVKRSSALYSIDDDVMGYGFMWWVFREPRFERYGMYAALGVGNQMIAVLPEIDVVIVNRANTYEGEGTPLPALLDLIEQVLEARTGEAVAAPQLTNLAPDVTDPLATHATDAEHSALSELVGEYAYPPPQLGLPQQTSVSIELGAGHVVATSPTSGTFKLYLQPDGSLHEEDSHELYAVIRNGDGEVTGIADRGALVNAALMGAAVGGRRDFALALLDRAPEQSDPLVLVSRAIVDRLTGHAEQAATALQGLARGQGSGRVESVINQFGYRALSVGFRPVAVDLFTLNTELFPGAFNTWDSLGEAYRRQGDVEDALSAYQRSLELEPENGNAQRAIDSLKLAQLASETSSRFERALPELMEDFNVPGAAVALVKEGRLAYTKTFGVRRGGGDEPVDGETVFQAASLSKPIVAYGALLLVQQGLLDLDRPLLEYLEEPYVADERAGRITARHVLSHSTGFPNWRPGHGRENPQPLRTLFEPGTRFRYSGEGFVYLQHVMRQLTGERLDRYLRRAVLDPLGMFRSSFVWHERFESTFAAPHDREGVLQEKRRPSRPLAAGTLHTTAGDYARFVATLIDPERNPGPLEPGYVTAMLERTSEIDDRLGWSLGWGHERRTAGDFFWQWGDDGPFTAFAAGSPADGTAVVILTNGFWGLDVARKVVAETLSDPGFLSFRNIRYRP